MGVQAANDRAMAGVLAGAPRLVAVRPARGVGPGRRPELVLHAGPPASWDELSPLLRTALAGAAELEGLSVDELVLGAAQEFSSMAGGAGAITASPPVAVVEDATTGRRAFHFLMEGFGRALILGMTGDDVFERLPCLRDEAAPALEAALPELGGCGCALCGWGDRVGRDHGRATAPRRRAAQPQRRRDVDARQADRAGSRSRT